MTIKANNYGVYKVRICIHQKLQPFFKRKEINKSLYTKSYKVAKTRSAIIISKYSDILEVVNLLDDKQIQSLVDKYIKDTLDQDLKDRREYGYGTAYTNGTDFKSATSETITLLKDHINDLKQDIPLGKFSYIENYAKDILDTLNISLDKEDDNHLKLLQKMSYAQIKIFEEVISRYQGNEPNQLVRNYEYKTNIENDINKRFNSLSYSIDKYLKYYASRNIDEIKKESCSLTINTKLIYLLADSLECSIDDIRQMDIENIDSDLLLDIQFKMYLLPASNRAPFNSIEYRNDYSKVINYIDENDDYQPLSPNTVKDYVDYIKQFFKYCHSEGLTKTDKGHLLSATRVDTSKIALSKNDVEQLKRVINDDTSNLKNIILINYLYTSFRRSEFYNSRVLEDDGIIYFEVLEGKNNFAKRLIPLHKDLISFYESLKCTTASEINQKLEECKSKISVNNFGSYFNDELKGKLSDFEFKTLHSTRKYFATELTIAKVEEGIIKYLMGHTYKDTTNRIYVDNSRRYSMRELKNTIDKINF